MKKILVTGENSFIGNSFENWINQKYKNQYHIDKISLRGKNAKDVDFSNYDCVLYVTGIAHVDTNNGDKEQEKLYYKINTELTTEMAIKSKNDGVSQFVFLSSIIVYGDSGKIGENKVIDKNTVPKPNGFYGGSKLKAEENIIPLNDENFKVACVRPPMIYGKGSKGNYPKLAKLSGILPFFPEIQNQRSMLHIDNLCEFLRLIIDNDESGIFYPQNKEYVNTTDLVKKIAKVKGKKIKTTKIFNTVIKFLSGKINLINKVFGNLVYDKELSNYKNFEYCIYDFEETIKRTEI